MLCVLGMLFCDILYIRLAQGSVPAVQKAVLQLCRNSLGLHAYPIDTRKYAHAFSRTFRCERVKKVVSFKHGFNMVLAESRSLSSGKNLCGKASCVHQMYTFMQYMCSSRIFGYSL